LKTSQNRKILTVPSVPTLAVNKHNQCFDKNCAAEAASVLAYSAESRTDLVGWMLSTLKPDQSPLNPV
jgi:hypothetical protein